MPDHAHFIIVPAHGYTISQTMRVVKGAIARCINALRGVTGAVWQDGFRDNAPATVDELNAYMRYVEDNPRKAGLISSVGAYPFSSARYSICRDDYNAFFEREREA